MEPSIVIIPIAAPTIVGQSVPEEGSEGAVVEAGAAVPLHVQFAAV